MKCAVHTDVDATGFCRNCGKPLCPQCTREVRGAFYCENCLSNIVFGPDPSATPSGLPPALPSPGGPTTSRPAAAVILGLIPGLGAVYNGQYVKALVHVCIFGSIIAVLDGDLPDTYKVFMVVAMLCFYFYMPIDAYRTAKARETGVAAPDLLPFANNGAERVPTGALILIGLGFLLLLENFGFFRFTWFIRLWPLGLVALGIALLAGRFKRTQ